MNPITERPPIVVDQQFEIIQFEDYLDPTRYPDGPADQLYIVGRVQATDVDSPDDETGEDLFYKITGGNFGDEEKAFGIVKDKSEFTKAIIGPLIGLDPFNPVDNAAIEARLDTDLLPGTILRPEPDDDQPEGQPDPERLSA